MPHNTLLALIGLPGTGKGTQGNILAHVLDMKYSATGDLIREILNTKKSSVLQKEVKKRYNKGVPQPDEVVNKIVRKKVKSLAGKSGLILDAYPLSMGQLEGLNKIVKDFKMQKFFVVWLNVPEKEIVRRLSSRKICSKCNTPYSGGGNKATCECGGELVSRSDDKPAVVRHRIKEYKKRYKEILKYYRTHGKLITISADQSIASVHIDILNELRDRGVFK